MREIKFRLRTRKNEIIGYAKWYSGHWNNETEHWEAVPCWLYSGDNVYWHRTSAPPTHTHKDQYTGLKDSEGQEVFEDDILEYILEIPLLRQATRRGYVEWDDTFASWMVMFSDYGEAHSFLDLAETFGPSEFKIIGNIYVNPELLIGGKK